MPFLRKSLLPNPNSCSLINPNPNFKLPFSISTPLPLLAPSIGFLSHHLPRPTLKMSMEAIIPLPLSVRRPTPDHPPYAEMVQFALITLAEANGSTESSISAFIQENYTGLPWGHSKLLPYYLDKMLVAGNVERSRFDPNLYVLPDNSAPSKKKKKKKKKKKPYMKKKPVGILPENRGRGRPRKYESGVKVLALKFKKQPVQGKDDGKELSLEEEGGLNAVDYIVENGKSSVVKMEENGKAMRVFQERDLENVGLDGVEYNMGNDKPIDTKMKENVEEMLVMQEKDLENVDLDGVECNVRNDKSIDTKMKENGEEMLVLQEKDLENVGLDGVECNVGNDKSSDTDMKENGEEMSVLQERDLENVGLDVVECNVENDKSIDMKMKENGEEMSGLQEKDLKGIGCNMQEKDFCDRKIDVNGKDDEMIPVRQEDRCSDKERCSSVMYNDNGNESELEENAAELLQDTPSKKSKMKTRKLWFES